MECRLFARIVASACGLLVASLAVAAPQAGAGTTVDADGTTPLHWAVQRNDLVTIDHLIAARSPVNASNFYGVTPLWLAASNGNAAAAGRLLKAGADPNLGRAAGDTPLMMAARAGKVDVVNLLIAAGADVHARESTRGQTALMWAAHQGNAEVIRAPCGQAVWTPCAR
jgi:ankyrin repeat protein